MWKSFHAKVTDPLRVAGIPLLVTPGNHDASAYGGFEGERRIFAAQWRARKPVVDYIDDADYPFFYAFRMKNVTFVSLDATVIGPLQGGRQSKRLRALAKRDETLIAFSHLPLSPFAIGRETEIIGDTELQNVFRSIDLDLHLSGHHHAFYTQVGRMTRSLLVRLVWGVGRAGCLAQLPGACMRSRFWKFLHRVKLTLPLLRETRSLLRLTGPNCQRRSAVVPPP